MSCIKEFTAGLFRNYENWKQSKCQLMALGSIRNGHPWGSVNMISSWAVSSCGNLIGNKGKRKMQKPRARTERLHHIKVRREFGDATSCLAFNLPWLHSSVKLLSFFFFLLALRYLRGEKMSNKGSKM